MEVKRIGIALPMLGISGGINIILNWGVILSRAGYEVELILPPQEMDKDFPFLAERDARLLRKVTLAEARRRRYHAAIATWWATIPTLADLEAEHYVWFMQAFEAQFFPPYAQEQAKFDELISSEMNIVAIAPWLQRLAERHYGLDPSRSFCVLNPLDKSLWRPMSRVPLRRGRRPVRFLVEGPSIDPRKNIIPTVRLLEGLKLPYSWVGAIVDRAATGPHCRWVEEQVPYHRMPSIYADSDVLVKASNAEGMFGPPLEMFATGGTAVCWDVQGAEEYMADRYNCRLTPMNSWPRLAEAILELADDPNRVRTLQENALATAEAWPTWADQADQILATIESLVPTTRSSLVRQISRVEFLRSDPRAPADLIERHQERLRYIAWLESEIADRDQQIDDLWAEAHTRGQTIDSLRYSGVVGSFRRVARKVGRTGKKVARLSRHLVGHRVDPPHAPRPMALNAPDPERHPATLAVPAAPAELADGPRRGAA